MEINATLVCINCDCPDEGAKALQYSSRKLQFNDVILITSTDKEYIGVNKIKCEDITSVKQYSDFMLNLSDYVDDNVLIVQADGYVVNPDMWDDKFYEYDYIGAPWPDDERWINDQAPERRETIRKAISLNRVGNGGFSYRSKKFLEYSKQFSDCGIYGEDIFLTAINYENADRFGILFAPLDVAYRFSYENRCKEFGDDYRSPHVFDIKKHFGFHACNFINQDYLINLKNDRQE